MARISTKRDNINFGAHVSEDISFEQQPLQVINSKNQTLAMYKSMVQNLDVVASKLEVLLTLILNDPDFYSPLIYHFFNNH
jgi:hypothetical protein